MLRANISKPYELTCITNMPRGVTECDTYPLWDFPEVKQGPTRRTWDAYRRLKLFEPETGERFGERIVSIDLDVLIDGDISGLFDPAKSFQGISGVVSHINASLFALKTGTNRHVWDTFDPETAASIIEKRRVTGSDQAWMSLQMPEASVWTNDDGVWTWKQIRKHGSVPDNARFIAFAGNDKPWDGCVQSFVREKYMSYYH